MHDINELCERNDYRYIRHASIRGNLIAFCAELGKHKSKVVIMELLIDGGSRILKEIEG